MTKKRYLEMKHMESKTDLLISFCKENGLPIDIDDSIGFDVFWTWKYVDLCTKILLLEKTTSDNDKCIANILKEIVNEMDKDTYVFIYHEI